MFIEKYGDMHKQEHIHIYSYICTYIEIYVPMQGALYLHTYK